MKNVKGTPQARLFIAGICATATAVLLVICNNRTERTPPLELQGNWQTNNSGYEHCALKIDDSAIVIEAADGKIYPYAINSMERISTEGQTVYVLVCENPLGVEFIFWFIIGSDPEGPSLSFKNAPQVVWHRPR